MTHQQGHAAPHIVGEPTSINVGSTGLTQAQVSSIRSKLVEVVRATNSVGALVSVAMRVFAGERVQPGRKLPGLVVHTFAEAGVAEEVSHGLNRYPIGYLVLRRYPVGAIGDGAPENWNPLTASLQTDTAGLTCTVLFF